MRPLLTVCTLLMLWVLPAAALEPGQVAVVYNAGSAYSRECAALYARTRGIPNEQCVGLAGLPSQGELSRNQYHTLVEEPLMRSAYERGWCWPAAQVYGKKHMLAMVLMPDMPLRIRREATPPPGVRADVATDSACLDSELMMLGARYPLGGPLKNPFYKKEADLNDERPEVMSVCRIEAPSSAAVRRMILDPAEVEKRGLWGWVVVDQGGPYKEGEEMFRRVAELSKRGNLPLIHEESGSVFCEAYPLPQRVAVYFGWYTEFAAGPFAPSDRTGFRFAPGAVAGHLHSFSATSVKDPKRWVGALLEHGAAVTVGNTAEPFLAGCMDFGVFYTALVRGKTVAEAALAATPFVSWHGVVLGDPLYRPFIAINSGKAPAQDTFVRWRTLCLRSAGNASAFRQGVDASASEPHGALFAEFYAWANAEAKQPRIAIDYFEKAAALHTDNRDSIRCLLAAAALLRSEKQTSRADSHLGTCLRLSASSPFETAVRHIHALWHPKPTPQK